MAPLQNWSEVLACPICKHAFDRLARLAVSLACGHCICRRCLLQLSEHVRVQCPLDNYYLAGEIAEQLPINRAILRILQDEPPAKSLASAIEFNPRKLKELEQQAQCYMLKVLGSESMGHWKRIAGISEQLALYLKKLPSERGASVWSLVLSRPLQRKLLTLLTQGLIDAPDEGKVRSCRTARGLGERCLLEMLQLQQNPTHLTANLWAAVRARGCQFLGPAIQEEVLKLILLALSEGALISRKTLVMYVVQALEKQYPQASKTSVGHVVQLLYRASCFYVQKQDGESSLMSLKTEFRTYESLRREHDAQLVQIAHEAGLHISPDQWSALLYGDQAHRSHVQSIIDKLQSITSFTHAIEQLMLCVQKTGDAYGLAAVRPHLVFLANLNGEGNVSWAETAEAFLAVKEVLRVYAHFCSRRNGPQYGRSGGTSSTATPDVYAATRYKTTMCRAIIDDRECPRGEACTYAHSAKELASYRYQARNRATAGEKNALTPTAFNNRSFKVNRSPRYGTGPPSNPRTSGDLGRRSQQGSGSTEPGPSSGARYRVTDDYLSDEEGSLEGVFEPIQSPSHNRNQMISPSGGYMEDGCGIMDNGTRNDGADDGMSVSSEQTVDTVPPVPTPPVMFSADSRQQPPVHYPHGGPPMAVTPNHGHGMVRYIVQPPMAPQPALLDHMVPLMPPDGVHQQQFLGIGPTGGPTTIQSLAGATPPGGIDPATGFWYSTAPVLSHHHQAQLARAAMGPGDCLHVEVPLGSRCYIAPRHYDTSMDELEFQQHQQVKTFQLSLLQRKKDEILKRLDELHQGPANGDPRSQPLEHTPNHGTDDDHYYSNLSAHVASSVLNEPDDFGYPSPSSPPQIPGGSDVPLPEGPKVTNLLKDTQARALPLPLPKGKTESVPPIDPGPKTEPENFQTSTEASWWANPALLNSQLDWMGQSALSAGSSMSVSSQWDLGFLSSDILWKELEQLPEASGRAQSVRVELERRNECCQQPLFHNPPSVEVATGPTVTPVPKLRETMPTQPRTVVKDALAQPLPAAAVQPPVELNSSLEGSGTINPCDILENIPTIFRNSVMTRCSRAGRSVSESLDRKIEIEDRLNMLPNLINPEDSSAAQKEQLKLELGQINSEIAKLGKENQEESLLRELENIKISMEELK